MNSGENFEPENTVPVPASGFVRRLAHTPHYDGVGKDRKEPTVICIFGQGQSSSNASIRASRQCGSSKISLELLFPFEDEQVVKRIGCN